MAHDRQAEILVVDNDERIVELVAWFLKKRGHRVRTADSFTAAGAAIAARRPDLMLSDIDLGSENALEELPRLDRAGALPPTLVVSGFLDEAAVEQLTALAPVMGTLAKPFDFAVLEERVRDCLGRLPAAGAPFAEGGAEPVSDDEGWVEITPARVTPAPPAPAPPAPAPPAPAPPGGAPRP